METESLQRNAFDLTNCVAVLGLTVVIYIVVSRTLCAQKTKAYSLPPSPPSEPLLGHYRVIPSDATFKRYAEWAKEYSA